MAEKFLLADLAATQQVAAQLARRIQAGQCVFLQGELGAGKTTLVQALLAAWGYQGIVSSPTYTLVEPYQFKNFKVFHFDLYRIQDPLELEYIGLSEYFTPDSICLIEWPERAEKFLPRPDWRFILSYGHHQGRELWVDHI